MGRSFGDNVLVWLKSLSGKTIFHVRKQKEIIGG